MKPDKPAHVLNIRKQSGWHLPVEINEQEITFLVDSGASCTMIDASIYQNLTKSIPLQLSPIADTFVLADGSQLEVLGEVVLEGRIGDQWYPMTLVVAEFGDNTAILGLDFMEDQDVILRLSLGKMMIGNETVVLHRENAEKVVIALAWAIPWLFLQDPAKLWRLRWTLGNLLAVVRHQGCAWRHQGCAWLNVYPHLQIQMG